MAMQYCVMQAGALDIGFRTVSSLASDFRFVVLKQTLFARTADVAVTDVQFLESDNCWQSGTAVSVRFHPIAQKTGLRRSYHDTLLKYDYRFVV